MPGLKLWLLGAPRLERDGAPLKVERRKAVALLAYMALTGEAHSRETLATLLWPDYSETRAHANLRRTFWALKDALGETWVTADEENIGLVRRPQLWVDVDEFRRSLALCGTHGHAAQEVCPACLPPLSEAVSLYRDDFLAGFTLPDCPDFDEWQFFQSESLRRELDGALHRLVHGQAAQAEFEAAIPYARRWVALDPLQEAAQRQLMQLYAWTGQPAAALRQYQEYARVLHDELKVSPSAEMTDLHEAIKAQRLQPPSPADHVRVTTRRFLAPPPPLPPALAIGQMSAPFVARERELGRLSEFLEAALAGRGQVIFVTGEAGSGKTLLGVEFARRAQESYADLLVAGGTCKAHTGQGDPYLPFREALSLLVGDIEGRLATGAISRQNAERLWAFAPLSLPALLELGPDLIDSFVSSAALASRATAVAPAEADRLKRLQSSQRDVSHGSGWGASGFNIEQHRLFDQYTQVLQALAFERPLLLILDDLHWADLSSLSLLFHLAQRIGDSRILLVAAYRPEDVARGQEGKPHPLLEMLSEFKGQVGDVWLDLDRAAAAEGRRFVDALLDAEPNRLGEAFRQALFQQTEGHALFTVELLRDLRERGDLRTDEAGQWVEGPALDWERLPARVEGVIEKRIGRLPADLQRALRVASVEGQEFTAEVVARVQGVNEAELVRQLSAEAGRGHRLLGTPSLQWLGAQPLSRYGFRHHLFQQYLYHTLDETERAYLHAAVGEALEALHADQVEPIAAQLARHFQAAGRTDKAIGYLQQAGERARRLWANQEGIAHFNQGLALIHTLPGSLVRAGRELDLQLALGNALIAVKGYAAPEVGRAFSRARELCRQLGDTPLLFRVLVGLHRFYMVRGEVHTARELAEQILGLAQAGDDPGPLTEAHRVMGITLFYLGEFAQARAHFEQGIAHYDPERHPAHILLYGEDPGVSCLSYAAWACWFQGHPDQALEKSREALTLARPLAHPFSLARALTYAAVLHQLRREGQAAREQAEAAIDLSTEHGFPFWLTGGSVVRGWALVEGAGQDRAEAGIAQICEGLSAWQALGIELMRHFLLALLAEAHLRAGQAEEGLRVLGEALPVGAGVGRAWEAELYRLKGELLLMRGKAETEAEGCFLQALDIARQQGAKSLELRAALSLCRLLKRQGRPEPARQRLAEIYGWFSEGFETPDLQEARALLEEL